MIGKPDEVQYISSANMKGIVVTKSDFAKLYDANPDHSVITEEGRRLQIINRELQGLDEACAVIIYKKMQHLDTIRTQISNISLLGGIDDRSKIVPRIINRICNSVNLHTNEISFWVMKVYEPDYTIHRTVVDNCMVATGANYDFNVAAIMRDMDVPEEISTGIDRIWRDGIGIGNIAALALKIYKNRGEAKRTINASVDDM
jgi:hypothetical protein